MNDVNILSDQKMLEEKVTKKFKTKSWNNHLFNFYFTWVDSYLLLLLLLFLLLLLLLLL